MSCPKLKAELVADREEKDGAVYYRLSDPATGKEFRLYEIEYLIARMLDGTTPNELIVDKVHQELKFELTATDFQRFLRELGGLGFLEVADQTSEATQVTAALIGDEGEPAAAPDELERLTRSAILHIKQGMVGQARDFFLAARKCAPEDGKIATMLNHLDVVGDDDGPSDVEYLWRQASLLYPEIAEETGPPGAGLAPIPLEEQGRREGILAVSRGRRPWLIVAAGAFGIALGVVALGFLWPVLFEKLLVVETDKVRAQKVQILFVAEAIAIAPHDESQVAFERGGVVAEVKVRGGDKVKVGQLLARLKLGAKEEKQLRSARDQAQKIEKKYLGSTLDNERMLTLINDRIEQVRVAKDKVDALTKEYLLKPAADQAMLKKQIALAKRAFSQAKGELGKLKARAQTSNSAQQKLKAQLDAAKASESAVLAKERWSVLVAPTAGTVQEHGLLPNNKVIEKAPVVRIADRSIMRVTFRSTDATLHGRAEDGAAVQLLNGDQSIDGKLREADGQGVVVEVPDADGKLAEADPKSLKLIKETLENALLVAAAARVDPDSGYVLEGGIAVRRKIEWVEVRGKDAVAKSGVRPGDVMVTGPTNLVPSLGERRKVTTAGAGAEGMP